jgi:hypothetical protein
VVRIGLAAKGGGRSPTRGWDTALCEDRVPKKLRNIRGHKAVVPPRLPSKSKETEEDERTKNGGPSSGLERIDHNRVPVQQHPGELEDARVPLVGVSPRHPWVWFIPPDVRHDDPNRQGDSEAEVEGGQSHKTPVAAVSQAGVAGDKFVGLLSRLHEGADGEH